MKGKRLFLNEGDQAYVSHDGKFKLTNVRRPSKSNNKIASGWYVITRIFPWKDDKICLHLKCEKDYKVNNHSNPLLIIEERDIESKIFLYD